VTDASLRVGDLAARWVEDQITLSDLRLSAPGARDPPFCAGHLLTGLAVRGASEWLFWVGYRGVSQKARTPPRGRRYPVVWVHGLPWGIGRVLVGWPQGVDDQAARVCWPLGPGSVARVLQYDPVRLREGGEQ
jgi:hypothetical protein